ncbi:MAG: hypothetical protein TE42_10585 [Candidatus Synechococcus spongiarum SP3]|uniref:Uncharacterized protein n=1 Tax=Candidatus Synechococcus spongiarum SP3 TaxID=1604020 RepID=A0A0G2HJS4_9SYNE|nr:MAG: hypothetical protein TE42_10585 [Candidatus Synechococcus spongiarum SP3]
MPEFLDQGNPREASLAVVQRRDRLSLGETLFTMVMDWDRCAPPSTLRIRICVVASNARKSIGTVSAQGENGPVF